MDYQLARNTVHQSLRTVAIRLGLKLICILKCRNTFFIKYLYLTIMNEKYLYLNTFLKYFTI